MIWPAEIKKTTVRYSLLPGPGLLVCAT